MLLVAPLLAVAQSGRRTTPAPSNPTQRPRRAVATPTPAPTPQATPAPANQTGAAPAPAVVIQAPAPPEMPAPRIEAVELDEDDTIRIASNLVPLPATVVDAQGQAITNLALRDFELRVDGELRQISEISRAETPVRIVMLFDNSASLTVARNFERQAAIRFFRNVLRPVDQAAIFSFSTVPKFEIGLTSDVNLLVRTIERFGPPDGATALFDTIVRAADYMRPHLGRKVIVIVSDGADTLSSRTFDEALQYALFADCQIYVVQTGHSDHPNLRDLIAERRMEVFAAETGGAVYRPRGTTDLDDAFAQVAADLAQQYILSYYPANEPRDGRFRTISLRVVGRNDVRIRTRRGYYAPRN